MDAPAGRQTDACVRSPVRTACVGPGSKPGRRAAADEKKPRPRSEAVDAGRAARLSRISEVRAGAEIGILRPRGVVAGPVRVDHFQARAPVYPHHRDALDLHYV